MLLKYEVCLYFCLSSCAQVANYVNGGHYNPHHDYVMKEREPDHVRAEGERGDSESQVGSLTLGGGE